MQKKNPTKIYDISISIFVSIIAPLYWFVYKILHKTAIHNNQRDKRPTRIVLLVSRPQDIALLIGLHEKAQSYENLSLTFWVVKNCAKRYPEILTELKGKNIPVEMVVSTFRLGKVLNKLMKTDVFLSTVESTAARQKLPYIITRLANTAGLSTYILQHGFETIGLTYCDKIHGPEVKFSSKIILTWGPSKELPAWVSRETRDKVVAVGCPKKLIITRNKSSSETGERPIIAVFDNLHWHRYDEQYVATFLNHLEETARQRQEFRFILKSHPVSIRRRSKELTARLSAMENVDIADRLEDEEPGLTTPLLLSHAMGVITTPSTIALDGALAGVPVAITRYGLDLSYYTPLTLFDNLEDWQRFLERLMEESDQRQLKLNGERFLNRVLVSGDPATKILNLLSKH
jgi:hypothetical protein